MAAQIIFNDIPKVIITFSDQPKRIVFLEEPVPYVTSFKGKNKK